MADQEVNEVAGEVSPEDQIKALVEMLSKLSGPSQAQIEQWKQAHGDVLVSAFSDTEVYLIRPLKRGEFKELQLQLVNPEVKMDQLAYEEAICAKCVLWPQLPENHFSVTKGGTATTLAEQIMQNSNFMTPGAPVFIAKL